jgi:pimeloyl-ACP methyl ester carboxylesterase
MGTGAAEPRPFRVDVPDEVLTDLHERLDRVRWADQIPGSTWEYGTDSTYLRDLVTYWRHDYDWRAQEARINELDHFTVPLAGIDVHFVHAPGIGPDPMPLLLCHGWPGSFWEFHRILPLLTDPGRHGGDPADAFTVVAPSLPGYGFSFRPGQRRFDIRAIAEVLGDLMTEVLGYDRYAAQGGDWGGGIVSRLGADRPKSLVGIHLNLLFARPGVTVDPSGEPDAEERAALEAVDHWLKEETGYGWIQGTRPQTLAYALTDSPVGLAAWIVEKFRAWSDCGGDVESRFPGTCCSPTSCSTGSPGRSGRRSGRTTPSDTAPRYWPGASGSTSPPAMPPSPRRSSGRSGTGPTRSTTSAGGRRCPRAATSPPSRSPRRSPRTFGRSSATCADGVPSRV